LQQLIWLANKLSASDWLAGNQLVVLKENLLSIYESMAYENIGPADTVMVNGSTIRYSCVLLAKTLLNRIPGDTDLLELLVRAREDALPEVRFAELAEA
jgi:hypothetical protein